MTASDISIYPYTERSQAALAEIDRIFFEASSVRSFECEAAQAAFRERWLGRYLGRFPQHAFVAMRADRVVGYIVGAVGPDPIFADVPSTWLFADLLQRFPAHLHINVAAAVRDAGVGSRLIQTFLAHLRSRGAPGVHLVTGEGSRNIRFYEKNGFRIEASRPTSDRVLVFMARRP
jgi:ribosomal protein S18 acetylase RimI-like enzyme